MPVRVHGKRYYRTGEACRIAGMSRNTFLRWIRDRVFKDVDCRDRRGWRLFTEDDVRRLREEVNRVNM